LAGIPAPSPSARKLNPVRLRSDRKRVGQMSGMREGDMGYHRCSRLRRILKWFGLSTCLLLVAVWIASLFCRLYYASPNGLRIVGIGNLLVTSARPGSPPELRWTFRTHRQPIDWRVVFRGPRRARLGTVILWCIPLWIPFVLVAIPTLWLWVRDRRPPTGYCQNCGYNLTGNESGKCPECGVRITILKPMTHSGG